MIAASEQSEQQKRLAEIFVAVRVGARDGLQRRRIRLSR